MTTTKGVVQVENKKTYDELLRQIKNEHETRAKVFIPQLCRALENEDPFLSKEGIRDRVKKDLIDIWSKTTIEKNIPSEFKDKAKQEAKRKSDETRAKNIIEPSVT